jgi:methionine synthase II (cobalamin-independent)
MLNHFRAKLPAFQDANRSKPISRQEPNVLRPAAVCRCPIEAETDLGLVVEFRMVSVFARGPVKITMAGPHLLAVVAYDEYYNDMPHMMADLGKMLNRNFLRLAIAGVGTSRSTRRISPWPMTPRSALQSPPSTRRSKVCRRMSM